MGSTEQSTRASAALDDLYRRHVGDVYRYTYAVLGNHADAEDVTQTTFVNALRALERGEQPRNAANWLLAISHNLVRQRWRQTAARPAEIELVGDVPVETPDDEIELEGLVKALQRIPPAQREALVMRELEGRSYQEICELLGLTTSAVETLLFRARRSLADELENLVTCQGAELALSQRQDGRLSRKERRRLQEHLDECNACTRLASTQAKQRRAFKGLALLPVPIGLTLFKGAPAASAAVGLPSIGGAAAGTATTTVGATGVGVTGAATGTGAAAMSGSLMGGAVAKVAAVVAAATVATGVGYEGLKVIRADVPEPTTKRVERARSVPSKPSPARSAAIRSSSRSPAPAAPSAPVGSTGRGDSTRPVVTSAPGVNAAQSSTASERRRGDAGAERPVGQAREAPPAATPRVVGSPRRTPETTPAVGATPNEDDTGTPLPTGAPEAGTTGCPGGGAGPGSGAGCGLGQGSEQAAPENVGKPASDESRADPGKPPKP